MEAKLSQTSPLSAWMDSEKMSRKPIVSLQLPLRYNARNRLGSSVHLPPTRTDSRHKQLAAKVLCSQKKYSGAASKPAIFPASLDEANIFKKKSDAIEPYLSGRCIYLVGMMGSGKTTIGRILSEVLDYSFYDSDALIEEAVGCTSVAEIFKLHGEPFFRDNETDIMRKLSLMHRVVISTGGGVVMRPINWRYMQKGLTVWLDVPLEALARRISSVGTESRPLLHQESGDAYTKALTRLTTLMADRGDAYPNANVRVSFENVAAKLGHADVCNLTPSIIVNEVLDQLKSYLEKEQNWNVERNEEGNWNLEGNGFVV